MDIPKLNEDENYIPFADDTLHSLYQQAKSIEDEILRESKECRDKGIAAIEAKNHYDGLKHTRLVTLFSQESQSNGSIKRTEKQREAMYRTEYSTERTAWVLKEREWEVSKDYLKNLQAVLSSLQTRSRLLKGEYDRE